MGRKVIKLADIGKKDQSLVTQYKKIKKAIEHQEYEEFERLVNNICDKKLKTDQAKKIFFNAVDEGNMTLLALAVYQQVNKDKQATLTDKFINKLKSVQAQDDNIFSAVIRVSQFEGEAGFNKAWDNSLRLKIDYKQEDIELEYEGVQNSHKKVEEYKRDNSLADTKVAKNLLKYGQQVEETFKAVKAKYYGGPDLSDNEADLTGIVYGSEDEGY